MKKKKHQAVIAAIIAFVFIFTTAASVMASYGDSPLYWGSRGEYVKNLQADLTKLGYSTYGIDGIFGDRTHNAVVNFQKANGIKATGTVANVTKNALTAALNTQQTHKVQKGDTLYKLSLKYGTTISNLKIINKLTSDIIYPGQILTISGKQQASSQTGNYPQAADWWTVVSKAFPRGAVATVTDVDTGITYQVKRTGGSNHADVQPLTAKDTAKMKQAYGGYWSWTRRAIIVRVNGYVFAASQNGMPHGNQTIYDNNFPGHCCIHFKNSRTHGTNRVDEAHQSAVLKASKVRL